MNHRRLTEEYLRELELINKNQKVARQPEPTSRYNQKTPLVKEVPFGPEGTQQEREDDIEHRRIIEEQRNKYTRRIRMKSPTQRDRIRIIKAKLTKARMAGLSKNIREKQQLDNPNDREEPFPFDKEAIKLRDKLMSRKKKFGKIEIICPVKLREKIGKIRTASIIDDVLNNHFTKTERPRSSTLIDQEGNILEPKSGGTHYSMVRDHAESLGIKLTPDPDTNMPIVGDEHIHQFLQKTNTIRLQHFPHNQKISLHISNRLTPGQIKTIKDLEKSDPQGEIGYAVGSKFENMNFGSGVRNLLGDHMRQFAQKQASEQGEINMTYQKSKKIKLLKDLFRDTRVTKKTL